MYRIFGKTDVGLSRSSNQDALNWGMFPDQNAWAVVCDGMGGANGGNIASRIAVDIISEYITDVYKSDMSDESIREMLFSAIEEANSAIFEEACNNLKLIGMGTTAVVSIIKNNKSHIAYVGDSRAYLVTKEEATQITRDHSVVQKLIDQGKLTEDEAKNDPRKSIITRAVGVDPTVEVDYCSFDLSDNEYLLICTDGLSNYLSGSRMSEMLFSENQENLTEKLINEANKNGGGDNITVILLCKELYE